MLTVLFICYLAHFRDSPTLTLYTSADDDDDDDDDDDGDNDDGVELHVLGCQLTLLLIAFI